MYEPTLALDKSEVRALLELFESLQQEADFTGFQLTVTERYLRERLLEFMEFMEGQR